MYTPESKYQRRVDAYGKRHETLSRSCNLIGNIKLLVFFAGAALIIGLFLLKQYILLASALVILASGYIYLSSIHSKQIKRRSYAQAMLQINTLCLKRAKGQWTTFTDTGKEFEDSENNYTYDLDLFGNGSLFQMLNMTTTYSGRNSLANMFLKPLESSEDIVNRQEAVKELARKLYFRHRIYSSALITGKSIVLPDTDTKGKKHTKALNDTIEKLDDVFNWAKEETKLYSEGWFRFLITALPVTTIIITVLSLYKILPFYLPIAGFVIQFLMLGYKINFRNKSFELVEKYSDTLKVYGLLLKKFETESFASPHMLNLKKSLHGEAKLPAWRQIEKLSRLWDIIANRYNFLHIVINTITLWDFHCMVALEGWKQVSGKYVERWFEAIGEVEALSSLSIMCHDNPEYIMPKVSEKEKTGIVAQELGHPLLTKGRRCNDITIEQGQPILLITGSNMSGISSFLRTVGLSLILSYIGLPVCT